MLTAPLLCWCPCSQEANTEQVPWQILVAHQQLEALIDQMSYEELYEQFGGAPQPAAASEEAVKALPSCKVTAHHVCVGVGAAGYSTCAICLAEFQPGDCFRTLGCTHTFHQACVDTWLLKHRGDCPVCRQKVG